MFDFFAPRKIRLPELPGPKPCLSWYGHGYTKLSEVSIYCPICGDIKKDDTP